MTQSKNNSLGALEHQLLHTYFELSKENKMPITRIDYHNQSRYRKLEQTGALFSDEFYLLLDDKRVMDMRPIIHKLAHTPEAQEYAFLTGILEPEPHGLF